MCLEGLVCSLALPALRNEADMQTISEIEQAMSEIMLEPQYERIKHEYHRMLDIMGNVDGDEIIALVSVAIANVTKPKDWWQP